MIVFRRVVQNPDGTHQQDSYVVTVDVAAGTAGAPTPLAITPFGEYRPTWSPDGTRIAFARDVACSGCTAIFIRDLATGNEVQLPFGFAGFNSNPEWSPDGTRIAFDGPGPASEDIFIVNIDGTGLSQISFPNSDEMYPTWSPDGGAIAFQSSGYCIVKLNLATGVVTQIPSAVCGHNPDWSP